MTHAQKALKNCLKLLSMLFPFLPIILHTYWKKGLGTDEETLNRVLVTRHEIDMEFIRSYYKAEQKNELVDDIIGDTAGNYQKITTKLANM